MQINKNFFLFIIIVLCVLFPQSGEATTLSISPASGNYAVGSTFSVSIIVTNSAAEAISGIDIKDFNYNPAVLRADSVTPGTLLPITQTNTINAGDVTFQQVSGTNVTYTGTSGTVATVNFTALAAGTSNLSFDFTNGATTDTNVAVGGMDSLTAVTGGTITVGGTPADTTPPTVSASAPSSAVVSTPITLSATASDNVGVVGVQFRVNGVNQGAEDTTSPYSISYTTPSSPTTVTITAVARDAAGNETTSTGVTVSVTAPADTTPPTISNVSASGITTSRANIFWTTDEVTTGVVLYGVTTSYGSQVNDTNLTTLHGATLSGLSANTTYHYRITATDSAQNSAFTVTDHTFTTQSLPDTQPPNAITNLSAGSVGQTSMTLSWTAPADLPQGNAASYDIRYSTSPLNESNWASATQATGEPTPGTAGTAQTYILVGLNAGTTYYIGIKSADSGARISTLSNVVTQATQAAPQVPTATLTGNNQANTVTISYNTSVTLAWNSTNATSCTSSGGWTGSRPTSGTFSTGNLTASQTYTITCTGAGGTAQAVLAVNVLPQIPVVDLLANSQGGSITISYNTAATLTWTSTNASTCTATGGTGGWAGTRSTSGSFSTGNLTASQTYTLSCTGAGGTSVDTVTVNVSAPPAVTLSFTATGGVTNITLPASNTGTTLTWTSTNATTCTATGGTGGWAGTRSTSGSFNTASLTLSQTYTLNCTGAGSPSTQTVNVNVSSPQPAPTVALQVNGSNGPLSINSGTSATLTWTVSNATSCTASGAWSGAKAVSGGTEVVANVTASGAYTLSCSNTNGTTIDSVDVTVVSPLPTVDLDVNGGDGPITITTGQSVNLSWTSTNAASCTASGIWSGAKSTNGSETISNVTNSGSFTVTCTGAGGTSVDTVTVNVSAIAIPTVDVRINGSNDTLTVASGSSITISWTSAEATTCSASGDWTGTKGTSGSEVMTNITQSRSYILGCSNANATQYDSVSVSVQTTTTPGTPGTSGGGNVPDTTAPAAPGSLVVLGLLEGVYLQWQNPNVSDFVRVVVVRKEGSAPTGRTDGTVIYEGVATQVTDTTAITGRTYYYGVFAFDTSSNYSSGASGSAARGALTEAQAQAQLATVQTTTPATPCVPQQGESGVSITRTLSRGARGNDVLALQRFLNANGFQITSSGSGSPGNESTYFGALTEAAVKRFQCARNVACSGSGYGTVGPRTRAALASGGSPSCTPQFPTGPSSGGVSITRTLVRGVSAGEDIRQLQRFLNAKGFTVAISGAGSPGNETTTFGLATESAVKRYQCARGIACSGSGYGTVGPRTRAALASEQ